MYINIHELIDIKEVEKELQLSNFQVKKLISDKRLIPINIDSWRIDGKFLFDPKEVERLKEEVHTAGMTLSQASKLFNVSLHYLKRLVAEQSLHYKEFMYRGRKTIFVHPEEIKELLHEHHTETIYSYSRKYHVVLFQKLTQGNTIARITKIQKRGDITVTDEFGMEVPLQEAYEKGYKLSYELTTQPRSNHKSFVTFRFPYTTNWRSNGYKDLDMLLQFISPSNLSFEKEEHWIIVKVRHSLVEMTMQEQHEFLGILEPYIIEGKISGRPGGSVFFDSNCFTKSIVLSEKQHQQIKTFADQGNITVEEWIHQAIQHEVNRLS